MYDGCYPHIRQAVYQFTDFMNICNVFVINFVIVFLLTYTKRRKKLNNKYNVIC